jgi:hypothetical protein
VSCGGSAPKAPSPLRNRNPDPFPAARRPRSLTAATRSRMACPPSASARRSHHPPTLRACGAPAGLPPSRVAPPTLYLIATIPDLWPRFPPSARSVWPDGLSLLAPVGETLPEAQTRRDRETCASLRFHGARFSPSTSEVGVAASPPLALSLQASAVARDTPQSGGRKRPPAHDVSRPSRRGPPQQRHADWGLRERESDWGRQIRNPKSEIRNPKFEFTPAGREPSILAASSDSADPGSPLRMTPGSQLARRPGSGSHTARNLCRARVRRWGAEG